MHQSSCESLIRYLYVRRLKLNRFLGRLYIVSNYKNGKHLNIAYNDYQLQGWEYYVTLREFLESDGWFHKISKANPVFDKERVKKYGTSYFYASYGID